MKCDNSLELLLCFSLIHIHITIATQRLRLPSVCAACSDVIS